VPAKNVAAPPIAPLRRNVRRSMGSDPRSVGWPMHDLLASRAGAVRGSGEYRMGSAQQPSRDGAKQEVRRDDLEKVGPPDVVRQDRVGDDERDDPEEQGHGGGARGGMKAT